MTTRSLRRDEAVARRALLDVTGYDVRLDLDAGVETFRSAARIAFTSLGGPSFVDLKPRAVDAIRLNGAALDSGALRDGRLTIDTRPGPNLLEIEAVMAYRNDGEGLHRAVDPADGQHYVYGMSFMDAAPSVFACFDQPDLKAPFTLRVRAPRDWSVVANSPGQQVEPGEWSFATTPPLSTYFVTLIAGPYHLLSETHDGIRLGLSARASIARELEAQSEEIFTITRQCFDEFHRLFGIRYPFGDYHQAFVPEFNAGAMENPGCVTFRDPLIFTSKATRSTHITRATTIAHEMAHQWFGNLTTPVWWDDLWLNESFAEYLGVRVTADVTEYADAWVNHAYTRRQWGLVADRRPSTHAIAANGAEDAASALRDFDGISYAKGSAVLKQLNAQLGDEVFLGGTINHFRDHWFGNATMSDLVGAWERAGAGDLSAFTKAWLSTAGVDRLAYDRGAGLVRRTPPAGPAIPRAHGFRVVTAAPGASWRTQSLALGESDARLVTGAGEAVVLDPYEDTWAVPHVDAVTAAALVRLLPTTQDDALRAGIWNALASTLHDGAIAPQQVLDVITAAVPSEESDDALTLVLRLMPKLTMLVADAAAARAAVYESARTRLASAAPGTPLQVAAARLLIGTGDDPADLRSLLDGGACPEGLDLDLDLRWRILTSLAVLGATDREELAEWLDQEPTADSRVAHVGAVASLPDAAAKAFAWDHFSGVVAAPNYELEAAGLGLWRPGQEAVTDPYVERYFAELPGTGAIRSGWMLGDTAEAFFPLTALTPATLARAQALLDDATLDPALRRPVVDLTDELARRLRVRQTYLDEGRRG